MNSAVFLKSKEGNENAMIPYKRVVELLREYGVKSVRNAQEPINRNYFNGSVKYLSFLEDTPTGHIYHNLPKDIQYLLENSEALLSLTDFISGDQHIEISINIKSVNV